MKDRLGLNEMVVERYYCKNKNLEGFPAQKCIYVLLGMVLAMLKRFLTIAVVIRGVVEKHLLFNWGYFFLI
jgi:hypothetical protein